MRIFSGIRPTGTIHIGNYLGAIKNWLSLQDNNECFFCIVDLHAITTPFQPEQLKKDIFDLAALYLALGLDPKKVTLFIQSRIPEHSELAWLLGTVTPLGELSRMTQYKEKSASLPSSQINAGLLFYPVLMAADILLYQTEAVPVGEDQKQHVELSQDLARKFNNRFGSVFHIPKAIVPKDAARIKSLRDPSKKMSKTDDPQGAISLLDSLETIKANIMSATTDSETKIKYDPERRPGIANLITIYSVLNNININATEKLFIDKNYRDLKLALIDSLVFFIEPIQKEYKKWINSPDKIELILESGEDRAKKVAQETIRQVKQSMGLSG